MTQLRRSILAALILAGSGIALRGQAPQVEGQTAVWKHEGKQWLLIQSSNTVATQHQSADELLRHP